jgi:hypothetical protein
LDEDDMMPSSVPSTVARTTTVAKPTATPTRGRSIVRERNRSSAWEREGDDLVTSSSEGGLDSGGRGVRGSTPPPSA